MNKLYHRIASKLQSYQCEFVKAEEPDYFFESVAPEDIWADCMIVWKCRCGGECSDFAYGVDRSTTPLCSKCEEAEIQEVLHKHYRVVALDVLSNWCQYRCEDCERTIDAGARLTYKKVLLNKFVCVQCNKQRR